MAPFCTSSASAVVAIRSAQPSGRLVFAAEPLATPPLPADDPAASLKTSRASIVLLHNCSSAAFSSCTSAVCPAANARAHAPRRCWIWLMAFWSGTTILSAAGGSGATATRGASSALLGSEAATAVASAGGPAVAGGAAVRKREELSSSTVSGHGLASGAAVGAVQGGSSPILARFTTSCSASTGLASSSSTTAEAASSARTPSPSASIHSTASWYREHPAGSEAYGTSRSKRPPSMWLT
mmetsp:Transcript_41977/g.98392  ORF Transcript_41977/g.98392 Transcript_41977/m.98392 type:complete len:240 (-) Transcript_41977:538-1257(-)